jgi:hypothetical protein
MHLLQQQMTTYNIHQLTGETPVGIQSPLPSAPPPPSPTHEYHHTPAAAAAPPPFAPYQHSPHGDNKHTNDTGGDATAEGTHNDNKQQQQQQQQPNDNSPHNNNNNEGVPAEDDGIICRICHEGPNEGVLISPCVCRGSMKYVSG